MRSFPIFPALVSVLCGLAFCAEAAAQIVVVPPGLSPGSSYRLAFVTSGRRNASSSNIADYNSFVTSAANAQPALVALGTTWTAIAATQSVAAIDNSLTNPSTGAGAPIYRLDGVKVADSNFDLWDGSYPDSTISITELGTTTPLSTPLGPLGTERPWVWTGSQAGGGSGAGNAFLGGEPIVVVAVAYSSQFFNVNDWIGIAGYPPLSELPFYGISGLLSVAPGGVPGDYNANGTVDGADYVAWRKGGPLANEVDTPGTVNAADYTAWRSRFGSTIGSGGGAGSGAAGPAGDAVPEPSAWLLSSLAAFFLSLRGRRLVSIHTASRGQE